MIKVSDSIRKIIIGNPFLEFGISYRLFNLTQLSKFIKPLIEVQTQKEVGHTAILMSLSRFQDQKEKKAPQVGAFKIENIAINSHLVTMTFSQNEELLDEINMVHNKIREKNGFWGFTQGTNEVAIFFEAEFLSIVKEYISSNPKYQNDNISCVGVRFSEKYLEIPGMLYSLIQKIALQNINLIELSSTYTEFNFYIEQKDVKLTFETLHDYFLI